MTGAVTASPPEAQETGGDGGGRGAGGGGPGGGGGGFGSPQAFHVVSLFGHTTAAREPVARKVDRDGKVAAERVPKGGLTP